MIEVPSLISAPSRSRALFLDRDGVINVNHGYVHIIEKFEFIDGIFELVRAAHANDFKVVVITNQSGIGRGFYSEQQFHQLTSWMCEEFLNEDAPIDKVYFSPFHPTDGLGRYKKDDFSRKPNPGMIVQAQEELGLDLDNSILVGDKPTDIQAGIAAGIGRNIMFGQAYSREAISQKCSVIISLVEAIPFLSRHV
ncbi:HAD family hydrolase [Porticoccaceae bacterium]|nr:HAD family hydrolase [Porticoccaceae bacterium]